MKPVRVSVRVPNDRQEVWDFLDTLANHEPFTDHMLVDWQCWGPAAGVGARARMRLKKPGRPDWLDMEVIAAEPPRHSVEESISARGRRRTRGSYLLEDEDGETGVTFELAWLEAPLAERLAAPLTRAIARRGTRKALRRLADQLAHPRTTGDEAC